jgi:CYTH domain-containing protein
MQDGNEVIMIAITGGPCGGKSTFLAKVHGWLREFGIQPVVITETATELINAGITVDLLGLRAFEEALLAYQLERENRYLSAARQIKGARQIVILCDRGALDCAAYVEEEVFARIAGGIGHSVRSLMERYKMVVHLMTAAWGAEKYYTLSNNKARTEGIELARRLDVRTQQAWLGHPHHAIVDNRTGFDAKMLGALQSLARVLNMPKPMEIERKFLILNFDPSFIPQDAVVLNITQDYLVSDDQVERRVRISELYGQESFYYTEKTETGDPQVRHEDDFLIDRKRYDELLVERDPILKTVKKERNCFIFRGKKLEVDMYTAPQSIVGLVAVEVEISKVDERIEFPDGWQIQEVTGVKKYKNRSLAERS